jgi:hypothetical protein
MMLFDGNELCKKSYISFQRNERKKQKKKQGKVVWKIK